MTAEPVMTVGSLVVRPSRRHQHVGLAQHVQQCIAHELDHRLRTRTALVLQLLVVRRRPMPQ